MISKICVFAASSPGIDDIYLDDGRKMAGILLENKITMIYGAGSVGIMGAMADEILKNNGRLKGIIPEFMKNMGWAHPRLKNLEIVQTMHERKRLMMKEVDAIIAMPGGVGTLEELLEAITLKQLGQFLKPIIILNTNGFYDPLISHFQLMIDQNFMRPLHAKIWQVADHPSEIMDLIINEPDWDPDAIRFAAVEANIGRVRTSGQ
ncbi:MAG: TIGR00730 family Rossman fold protein [Bacteroidales bacterium]|nr:TIGR00730 family Rossman fold protein [Bacteroidales bacterium]